MAACPWKYILNQKQRWHSVQQIHGADLWSLCREHSQRMLDSEHLRTEVKWGHCAAFMPSVAQSRCDINEWVWVWVICKVQRLILCAASHLLSVCVSMYLGVHTLVWRNQLNNQFYLSSVMYSLFWLCSSLLLHKAAQTGASPPEYCHFCQ